jgi:drug/metabolite transporter (DMT)-like permease
MPRILTRQGGAIVNDNARGILSVLTACTAFVINDAMVKLAGAELPSGEIIFIRGALATMMVSIGVLLLGASRPLSLLTAPMMLVRLGSSAAAIVFIVICLRHLPLATVNTVLQVTPLAVTAGAALVFRERVSLQRWAAALTGFLGVALMVRPDAASIGAGASFVLVALLFTTIRDLTTRGLAGDIPSIFVAAASAAAISAAGFAVAPFDDPWRWPSERAWVWLTLAAGCLFIATTFMVVALSHRRGFGGGSLPLPAGAPVHSPGLVVVERGAGSDCLPWDCPRARGGPLRAQPRAAQLDQCKDHVHR